MNISFVLAVYNKLELTKECYKNLRKVYPKSPLVISSGGSGDGTKEWLESLEDENLSFFHDDDRLTFSETYNAGIDLVDTEKRACLSKVGLDKIKTKFSWRITVLRLLSEYKKN